MWTVDAPPVTQVKRVIPDGCLDLIHAGDRLLVAGPDTGVHLTDVVAGVRVTGLRFAPGLGPLVFGVPAHELTDLRVPLEQVLTDHAVRELVRRCGEEPDSCTESLEAFVSARLSAAPDDDDVVSGILSRLGAGRSVRDTAAAVALSERQLRRRSLDAFGYGPKTLARVLRLNRALDLVRAGVAPATVAQRCGYSDQAHLSHETVGLTGITVGGLASESAVSGV